jgi:hypothetical protein
MIENPYKYMGPLDPVEDIGQNGVGALECWNVVLPIHVLGRKAK